MGERLNGDRAMKYQKILITGLVSALVMLGGCQKTRDEEVKAAYLDAAVFENGFIAAGTEGRLDLIAADGTVEKLKTNTDVELLAVASSGDTAAAAGEDGTALLLQEDNKVSVLSPNVKTDLYSVSFFGEDCFFGTEKGVILKTTDFKTWESVELQLEGNITGLAANEERCIAVTDKGETATTTDGLEWTILDYNEYYTDEVSFQDIESCDSSFIAYGTDSTDKGRALTTVEGGVWADRALFTDDEAEHGDIPVPATALCWDGEQAYAVRENGNVLTLPSCTSCNKLQKIGEVPLYAAACDGRNLLFAGQDYKLYLMETEEVRQERIKAPAALEKQQNGAILIDVRKKEDYATKHIAGAIYMDVETVLEKLPEICPDRECEIIFYCYSGKRSQDALEDAQTMGYTNVYNLGGMDSWEFDFEVSE